MNTMKRAHEIRREAAAKFGGKASDYSMSIALEMAWEEKAMKKQLEIGKDYGFVFGLDAKKGQTMTYLGGIKFIASNGIQSKEADSQGTYDKVLDYINLPRIKMGRMA